MFTLQGKMHRPCRFLDLKQSYKRIISQKSCFCKGFVEKLLLPVGKLLLPIGQ
jgi:hypothetical protein